MVDLQGQIQIQRMPLKVVSVRPFALQNLLQSRTPEQVVSFVGLAYSLCGQAQQSAARLALMSELSVAQRHQMQTAVMVESLKEHFLALVQLLEQLKLCTPKQHQQWLQGVGQWVDLVKQAASVQAFKQLLQTIQQRFLALGADLQDAYPQCTPNSPLYKAMQSFECEDYQGNMQLLDGLHAAPLEVEQLAQPVEKWHQWIATPTLAGQPLENSAWSRILHRQKQTSALAGVSELTQPKLGRHQKLSRFLQQRLMAKVVDAAGWMQRLQQPPEAVTDVFEWMQVDDYRYAWVETARGRLMHWAKVDEQAKGASTTIQAYAICAPTEWNFHPKGIAWQALNVLPKHLTESCWQNHARLIAQVIDPCVPLSFAKQAGAIHA